MQKGQKRLVAIFAILVLGIALISVAPSIYSHMSGPGVKVTGFRHDHAKPASVDLDGEWKVTKGKKPNTSAVGFTFFEILPGERKTTSGATEDVTGEGQVKKGQLTEALVTVDMTDIVTDKMRRDVNVRRKLLDTDKFPEASFELTKPADLAALPDDGTPGKLTLTGDMIIHGEKKEITHEFDAIRDGRTILISGNVPINRLDFGVETPEFIAAKVDEEGELNIRLHLERR